jgi:hypothetical protein
MRTSPLRTRLAMSLGAGTGTANPLATSMDAGFAFSEQALWMHSWMQERFRHAGVSSQTSASKRRTKSGVQFIFVLLASRNRRVEPVVMAGACSLSVDQRRRY